jgi:hypothetical protein
MKCITCGSEVGMLDNWHEVVCKPPSMFERGVLSKFPGSGCIPEPIDAPGSVVVSDDSVVDEFLNAFTTIKPSTMVKPLTVDQFVEACGPAITADLFKTE